MSAWHVRNGHFHSVSYASNIHVSILCMITLFRKIRSALLESGQSRKYLLYAIGEMILVIVGILIALQINNWNEYRKERGKEVEVLRSLAHNLESNRDHFSDLVSFAVTSNKSMDAVEYAFETLAMFEDSLSFHFNRLRLPYYNLNISRAGYETFKNAGFDIVQSESLRNEIIDLFEQNYVSLERIMENHSTSIDVERITVFYHDHFKATYRGLVPKDYDFVKNDEFYKEWRARRRFTNTWVSNLYRSRVEETEKVLGLIQESLGSSDSL